ncbi:hypothetical protein ACFVFH_02955 [Streptomyces sp. NPDC057697]
MTINPVRDFLGGCGNPYAAVAGCGQCSYGDEDGGWTGEPA